MLKLGVLMAATLAGLFVVLQTYGGTDLRADRRPAPAPVSAAQDAGAAPLTPVVEAQIIPAATQTRTIAEQFPGPALVPSPEYGGGPTPDADATPPVAEEGGPTLYVTGSRVNMRAGAGTGNPVVTALDGGSAVQAIGPTGGEWVQVRTAQGQQGFIAGQFLSSEAP